uniref:exopolysaccharide biosynthesis polyprenyl glycosylphosphotransferase n=1 Tax=Anaerovibrio slackiae TaxID=2652309 RepID=UPI003863ABC2
RVIREQGVQTVIVAAPGLSEEGMRKLLMDIQHLTDTVLFTPNLVGSPLGSVEISTLFVEQVAVIKSKNNLSRWYNRWGKFCFDMVVTVMGSILPSPFLLLLALVVGIDNRGRVIFAHRRVGRQGKPFSCYKFQTMVKDADKALVQYLSENADARKEWERSFKLADDPRVTRLGAFLRRTSLDELPQIVNVLKGEMSLVGPRPIVEAEMEMYGENIREYLMVRPGITGMWQTSGRSDTTYEERVQMDTWYVRNWSVWIDMKYLFKTFEAVVSKKGAY